VIDRS